MRKKQGSREQGARENNFPLCPPPLYLFPMPHAPCPMPNSLFP
ncbi:hypothetical protein COO91_04443 [Nostoc flagelliforme CCNUN1]|uniref:Uncharacterized protein n=1 Tax=Nostoc flagelliforme CCNUN1 TaxID=2038116 RepID=A0A2K8ST26_9NOSO|nr:hypothetical protein COO91_04443 [Nostoc flagelliforme CCNUN1]